MIFQPILPFEKSQRYKYINFVSEGAFGQVHKFWDTQLSREVAIKTTSKKKLSTNPKKLEQLLKQEIDSLKLLKGHPQIIEYLDDFSDSDNVYLVMEYFDGWKLDGSMINETETLNYFIQVLNALYAMSQKGISHRDIKPDNILIRDGKLKLIDFGFSIMKNNDNESQSTSSNLGTLLFKAPELTFQVPYSPAKADIFSSGVLLYVLLFESFPAKRHGELDEQYYSQINSQHFLEDKKCSRYMKDLLSRMLQVYPQNRISIDQIMTHQLFYSYDFINKGFLSHYDPKRAGMPRLIKNQLLKQYNKYAFNLRSKIQNLQFILQQKEVKGDQLSNVPYRVQLMAFCLVELRFDIQNLYHFIKRKINFFSQNITYSEANQAVIDMQSHPQFRVFLDDFKEQILGKFTKQLLSYLPILIRRLKRRQDTQKVIGVLTAFYDSYENTKRSKFDLYYEQIKINLLQGLSSHLNKHVQCLQLTDFVLNLYGIIQPEQYQEYLEKDSYKPNSETLVKSMLNKVMEHTTQKQV